MANLNLNLGGLFRIRCKGGLGHGAGLLAVARGNVCFLVTTSSKECAYLAAGSGLHEFGTRVVRGKCFGKNAGLFFKEATAL